MSSPCRNPDRRAASALGFGAMVLATLLAMPALLARPALFATPAWAQQQMTQPSLQSGPAFVPVSKLFPGGGSPPPPDPRAAALQGSLSDIAEGKRLFAWYNCNGCHFEGGGGMGPPLMDKQWIYGGKLDEIFASIAQGRPNGMPSWHGKIPDAQIWQLATFVKSLSANAPVTAGGQQEPVAPTGPSPGPGSPEAGKFAIPPGAK